MTYCVHCADLNSTEKLAKKFASAVIEYKGAFVSMFADVGCGKTTFIQFVCKYLDVKEKVTSPSFVILNEYTSGKIPVYHFDLYRLENEGVSTIINELDEYSEGNILTFIEWAQYSNDTLPFDRIELTINYIDKTEREFIFIAIGEKSDMVLKRLKTL